VGGSLATLAYQLRVFGHFSNVPIANLPLVVDAGMRLLEQTAEGQDFIGRKAAENVDSRWLLKALRTSKRSWNCVLRNSAEARPTQKCSKAETRSE
jgi:hypothetical protein